MSHSTSHDLEAQRQTQTQLWRERDLQHCWHPFTPGTLWGQESEMIFIESGEGVWLTDSLGRRYLDGNSSIWVNIHGHAHPRLLKALQDQAQKICHSSYLGFSHGLASDLAARLCSYFPDGTLSRVFFSDDGSTALETALKMAFQSCVQSPEKENRRRFLAFSNCYHGDTMGAASLGGVGTFFEKFKGFGMEVGHVSGMAELHALSEEESSTIAAIVIEPIIQGVNRMTPWPKGMLRELRDYCTQRGIYLICDEVMTGFGRTGTLFASMQEEVIPDFLCCAKGLTGGYSPLAACITTEEVYERFLAPYEENKTFYYGHSFTAHPLGCALAMANLDIFEEERTLEKLPAKIELIAQLAAKLERENPHVSATRQAGMVLGIDIVRADGTPYLQGARAGEKACVAMRAHGMLTRPVTQDTVVFMPPLSITEEEIRFGFVALDKGIRDGLRGL